MTSARRPPGSIQSKPHLWFSHGLWACSKRGLTGWGATPADAHAGVLRALDLQQRVISHVRAG